MRYAFIILALLITTPLAVASDVMMQVDPLRDLTPGDSGYYQLTITNPTLDMQHVQINVSDISAWAMYRVDESNQFTLQPGQQEIRYLYLKVNDNAAPGTKYFRIYANEHSADLKLAVLQPLTTQEESNLLTYLAYALAVVLLLIAAVLLVRAHNNKEDDDNKPPKEDQEDDFITFY